MGAARVEVELDSEAGRSRQLEAPSRIASGSVRISCVHGGLSNTHSSATKFGVAIPTCAEATVFTGLSGLCGDSPANESSPIAPMRRASRMPPQ